MIKRRSGLYWPIFGKESSQAYFSLYYYIWNIANATLVSLGVYGIKMNVVVSAVFYKKNVSFWGDQVKALKVLSFYSFKNPVFKVKKAYGKKRAICCVTLQNNYLYRFFGFFIFLSKFNEEVFLALNNINTYNLKFFSLVFREAGMFLDLGMFGLDFYNWFVPLVVYGEIVLVDINKELLLDNAFLTLVLSICKIYSVKREII